MTTPLLIDIVMQSLDDLKANDIIKLNVAKLTTITDTMVICSGTSTRHVKALSDEVIRNAKEQGFSPLGTEGQDNAQWVLVDLGDVVVHIMLPDTREFYNLEKLWGAPELSSQQESAV
ncbi:MAG: ribosome silencing factor [Legionellales bacterium]|nr:ribosome silencing factor [Legionellales bacterium]